VALAAAKIDLADDGRSLSGEDRARLAQVAQAYKNGSAGVRVIGHSRAAGIDGFDDALDHANAVAQALTQLGVPAGSITVEAKPGSSGRGLAEVQVEN
jgi:outer membrane protein OmpA-like peptidoglycan-associated protein